MEKLFDIIYEDVDLLVLNKPAGLVCHPTKTDGWSSLIGRVRLYLGASARPHLVNRLDRETSGVTIVARSGEAARELGRIWEDRQVEKEYLAIVHGHLAEDTGIIDAPMGKDEQSRVAIKDCVRQDGAPAQTRFRVEKRFTCLPTPDGLSQPPTDIAPVQRGPDGNPAPLPFSLLRVEPQTGRKHQIRIHLAHIGHPVVGDKLYGGDEELYLAFVERRLTPEQWGRLILPHHALHAREVRFAWRGRQQVFRAPPEERFLRFIEFA